MLDEIKREENVEGRAEERETYIFSWKPREKSNQPGTLENRINKEVLSKGPTGLNCREEDHEQNYMSNIQDFLYKNISVTGDRKNEARGTYQYKIKQRLHQPSSLSLSWHLHLISASCSPNNLSLRVHSSQQK